VKISDLYVYLIINVIVEQRYMLEIELRKFIIRYKIFCRVDKTKHIVKYLQLLQIEIYKFFTL
jgi:hypothetical protein